MTWQHRIRRHGATSPIKRATVKALSSMVASGVVLAIVVIVLAPLAVAAVQSLLVPVAIVVAVLVGLRLLWYWTTL